MAWSYRVVQDDFVMKDLTPEWEGAPSPQSSFTIYQVHYDKVEGCPGGSTCSCPIRAISEKPMVPFGDTSQELRDDLELMLKAFDRPILQFKDLPEEWFESGDAAQKDKD